MSGQEWLSAIGSIASVFGLIVSFFVLKSVQRLRTRYVRQAILTECLGKLKAHQTNLKSAISKKNLTSVRRYLSRIDAVCERIALHHNEGDGIRWKEGPLATAVETDDEGLLDEADRVLPALEEPSGTGPSDDHRNGLGEGR